MNAKSLSRIAKQHPIWSLIGLAAIAWAGYQSVQYYKITHPHYEHAVGTLSQNMQPHCFGRYQIDLPAGARVASASIDVNGVSVGYKLHVSHEEFEQLIAKRWQELQAMTMDSYKRPNAQASKKLDPVPDGVVFLYEYKYLEGPDAYGVDRGPRLTYQTEGYLWRDEVLYKIGKLLNGEEKIAALMPRIETRTSGQFPSRSGFCFGYGFLIASGGFEPVWTRVSYTFPDHKGFGLLVSEHLFNVEANKPLLQRRAEKQPMKEAMLAAALKQDPSLILGGKKYRAAKRKLGILDGEEITQGATEETLDFDTDISSVWETVGKSNSLDYPEITLQMGIEFTTKQSPSPLGAFPSKKIAPDALPEKEYFALWDAILKSLRPRPVAPATEQTKPKPLSDAGRLNVLPLGTQVSSLRSCPETGTYECASDAPGIVQRRVFLQQGRPMPSAFTVVPEKSIAGLLGRKDQQEVEIAWTLISYKHDV